MYNLKEKELNHSLIYEGHSDVITDMLYLPGKNKFITSSYDKTVRQWDLHSGSVINLNLKSEGTPISLAVNKVTEDVVVGTDEGELFKLLIN